MNCFNYEYKNQIKLFLDHFEFCEENDEYDNFSFNCKNIIRKISIAEITNEVVHINQEFLDEFRNNEDSQTYVELSCHFYNLCELTNNLSTLILDEVSEEIKFCNNQMFSNFFCILFSIYFISYYSNIFVKMNFDTYHKKYYFEIFGIKYFNNELYNYESSDLFLNSNLFEHFSLKIKNVLLNLSSVYTTNKYIYNQIEYLFEYDIKIKDVVDLFNDFSFDDSKNRDYIKFISEYKTTFIKLKKKFQNNLI